MGVVLMHAALTAVALLALSACQTISEVVTTSPGVYMVAASGKTGAGSAGEQKAIAIRQANDYCNGRALQMRLLDSRLTDPKFGTAPAAEVNFTCDKPI